MNYALLSIISLLLNFGTGYAQDPQLYTYDQIYSLDESTQIIRSLIKTEGLSQILLPGQEANIDFFINNYSPAYLAFEAEVLSHTNPVLVLCCNTQELALLEPVCKALMIRYPGLKIVSVNDETLPSIVSMFNIKKLPAFIFIDRRIELGRLEGLVDLDADFEGLMRHLGT